MSFEPSFDLLRELEQEPNFTRISYLNLELPLILRKKRKTQKYLLSCCIDSHQVHEIEGSPVENSIIDFLIHLALNLESKFKYLETLLASSSSTNPFQQLHQNLDFIKYQTDQILDKHFEVSEQIKQIREFNESRSILNLKRFSVSLTQEVQKLKTAVENLEQRVAEIQRFVAE